MLELNPPLYDQSQYGPPPDYITGALVVKTSSINASVPTVAVKLDSPETCYGIGEVITGKIIIAPKYILRLKNVHVVLEGEELTSKSKWVNTCTHGASSRTVINAGQFTVPVSSFPSDMVIRPKHIYTFPFSIQVKAYRSQKTCMCGSVHHTTIPPSFTNTVSSPVGNAGTVNVNNYFADHYNTGGPNLGIRYKVHAYVKHNLGTHDYILNNDPQRDYPLDTVNIISSYFPNHTDESKFFVDKESKYYAANSRARLEVLPGSTLIMSMNPKDQALIKMKMEYINYSTEQLAEDDSSKVTRNFGGLGFLKRGSSGANINASSVSLATTHSSTSFKHGISPSPKSISGQLICRTTYGTGAHGSHAVWERPIDQTILLQQDWVDIEDPNEEGSHVDSSVTTLTVGFRIPSHISNQNLLVPSFQSCLIKREYYLKMCVRTTDTTVAPFDLVVPVHVVSSLSAPVSAEPVSSGHGIEETLALGSFGVARSQVIASDTSSSRSMRPRSGSDASAHASNSSSSSFPFSILRSLNNNLQRIRNHHSSGINDSSGIQNSSRFQPVDPRPKYVYAA